MKWKIRLARDMGQEAFVVIEAPTNEEAEAILWHDMDPDVIQWSDDDVMGDREVKEVYPADDEGGGRGGHAAQRGETSPILADAAGHGDLRGLRGLPVSR